MKILGLEVTKTEELELVVTKAYSAVAGEGPAVMEDQEKSGEPQQKRKEEGGEEEELLERGQVGGRLHEGAEDAAM